MRTLTSLVLLLALAGCSQKPGEVRPSAEWSAFVDRVLEEHFAANPEDGVAAGRHEYDGKLPDITKAGIEHEIARLHAQRDSTAAFDAAKLDERQRFEKEYVLAVLDGQLFWLEKAETAFRNPRYYAGIFDPDVYVTRPYAPPETRMRAYIAYCKSLVAAIPAVRANLRTPMPRTFVDIGKISFGGMAGFFAKDVPLAFAAVKDPELRKQFEEANGAAIQSMKDLNDWFGTLAKSATDDFALGPDRFSAMLHDTERVDMPLDQLESVGRKDLARNTAALLDACAKFAPGKTAAECAAKMNADKPKDGMFETARRQLQELRSFVADKQLASIPGSEEANVAEAPAYLRWNAAFINIPGPYEKGLPSVYYIAPPDPSWSAKERDAYVPGEADLLFVSAHEVWPGHFLQFLHSNRSSSKFGQVFVGYAFAEGWAHYGEEMIWEAGLRSGDPETHVGQLLEALLRDVRFLTAIGLHTGKMTVAEAEKMFLDSAFSDPATARQQAARGTFDPAFLNYTLGKLMIRKLRDDWTATRGGREAWKAFHDQFLSWGGPPIPLVRTQMLGSASGPPL